MYNQNNGGFYAAPQPPQYPPYGYPPQPVYQPAPPKPKRSYSGFETLLAWVFLLIGFLFCRVSPVLTHPFGGFLLILAVYFTTFIFLAVKKIKLGGFSVAVGISGIIMALPLVLHATDFTSTLSYGYSVVAYLYFLYTAFTGYKKRFSNSLILELFKVLFVLPFYSFVSVFRALFSGKASFSGKLLLKVFLGLAIAILPTAIILGLLSYDEAFMQLIRRIFDFTAYDVFLFVLDIGFAIPVAMYLFGLYVSCGDSVQDKVLTAKDCKTAFSKVQVAPAITVFAAVVPVVFVYVIFFISQWSYYISGFTGDLPSALSYSRYAREGFFQLCVVSVINMLLTLAVAIFAKRREGKRSGVLTVTAMIFSVCTLVLIATAIAKMVMYINNYGLTPKRVYATWFMVFLGIVFILLILSRFIKKVKVLALSLAVFAVMLAGLALPGTNRMIAGYNVDRYLAGSIEELDYYSMTDLGIDGVPEFARLAKSLSDKGIDISKSEFGEDRTEYDLHAFLRRQGKILTREQEKRGLFSFNLAEKAAANALKSIGYME